jgi:outer membrane protein
VTAWGQFESAKAQILATQTQVASYDIAFEGVREEARLGLRTIYDILLRQQNLVNARAALITAQHDRVVASYALPAAVGELNLPKLGIKIPLYDPMVHYQQGAMHGWECVFPTALIGLRESVAYACV